MTQSFGSHPVRCCAPRVLVAVKTRYAVETVRPHGNRLLVRLSGVVDRVPPTRCGASVRDRFRGPAAHR